MAKSPGEVIAACAGPKPGPRLIDGELVKSAGSSARIGRHAVQNLCFLEVQVTLLAGCAKGGTCFPSFRGRG
jgi:hypothetical protein